MVEGFERRRVEDVIMDRINNATLGGAVNLFDWESH